MKKLLSLVLALAMCFGLTAAYAEGIYTPGTYEASVNGMNGPVVVKMEFSESTILSVNAVGEKETKGLGDVAIEKLIPQVMDKQSAEVDAMNWACWTGCFPSEVRRLNNGKHTIHLPPIQKKYLLTRSQFHEIRGALATYKVAVRLRTDG